MIVGGLCWGVTAAAAPAPAGVKVDPKKAVEKHVKSQATPSAAVKTFAVAMSQADFVTAKKCVEGKELVGLITMLEELIKEVPEMKKDAVEEFGNMAKMKIVSEKITGDTAEVVFTYKEKNKEKQDTRKLKKIGKDWKIIE